VVADPKEQWMTEQENVQLVHELYAAFGRGDVPAILDQLTDDVVWYDPGAPEVPHAGRYRGREGVGSLFARTEETLQMSGHCATARWRTGRSTRTPLARLRPIAPSRPGRALPGLNTAIASPCPPPLEEPR
jgi:hypothetical protein